MERIEILLDLLDRWDEMQDSMRVSPEEFCKEHPEFLEEFRKVLRQRGVLTAMLNGKDSPALNPDAMIERLQSGRFPVVKFHDQGGLGWVYIAMDRELGRTVALKCLQPDPATDPVACQRFVREAEITARLEHPGIVPIYGLCSYGVGHDSKAESPSYAMRFVQGETLRDTIRALHATHAKVDWRSIEATRILRSFVTVCETIAFAHSRGVIHRDLKSANIMIGAFGETLVLDWGLAKLQHETAGTADTAANHVLRSDKALDFSTTQTGATLGTVGFMSPEQAKGDWSKVDTASDVFSLGAILYQILTNQSPYTGSNALEAAKSCSFPAPRSIKPEIPKPLSAICLKSMRTDPSDRYTSALGLKSDIERYLADEPVSSRQESIIEKSRRMLRKHRTIAQMGALMALATIVMLSIFLNIVSTKNHELESANRREEAAKNDALRQRDRVQTELIRSIREKYAANMGQVSQALSDRQPTRLVQTLNEASPRLRASVDPRGMEWWMGWNKAYGHTHPIKIDKNNVIGIRLVDRGSKAILWTKADSLQIIDTDSGKEFLKLAIKGTWLSTSSGNAITSILPYERPSDIPCSEDGMTLVIPVGSELHVYNLEGERYIQTKTLRTHDGQSPSWQSVLVSENGGTIVGAEKFGTLHVWNGKDYQYSTFKDESQSATWERRLSPDGRYLALIDRQLPTLIDLETRTRFTLPDESEEKFLRVAFGQFHTLLAWNDQRVVTFAITTTHELSELWSTDVRSLAGWSAYVSLYGQISEWITLEAEASQLAGDVLRARMQTGNLKGLVRATTLAVQMGPHESPPRFHLLLRERDPGNAGMDVFDLKSQTPVRKTDWNLPNLGIVVDISSDGRTALIKNDQGEYATLASDAWAPERIYRRGNNAPVKAMAWTGNDVLRSVSSYGVGFALDFVGHEPPNFTRWLKPLSRTSAASREESVAESRTLPEGQCLGLSNDLLVLALNRENDLIVQWFDGSAKEFHCPIASDLKPYFDDAPRVGLRPWNRNALTTVETTQSTNQLSFGERHSDYPPTAPQSLSLPWVLCLEKHSVKCLPGDMPDGVRMAIVDYEASRIVKEIEIPNRHSRLIEIDPLGRSFALVAQVVGSPGGSEQLFTWSVGNDRTIAEGPALDLPSGARVLAFSASGTQIAIGTMDGYVVVIDLELKKPILSTKAYEGQVNALTFSPDGQRLIAAGDDKTLRFFSTRDWQEVMKFRCPEKPLCIAIDRNSQNLAIAYDSGHIGILTASTRRDLLDLATLWLNNEDLAADGEEAILRELWMEFVTSHGRPEDEIEAGLEALQWLRGKIHELNVDELRQEFFNALPPHIKHP